MDVSRPLCDGSLVYGSRMLPMSHREGVAPTVKVQKQPDEDLEKDEHSDTHSKDSLLSAIDNLLLFVEGPS